VTGGRSHAARTRSTKAAANPEHERVSDLVIVLFPNRAIVEAPVATCAVVGPDSSGLGASARLPARVCAKPWAEV